MKEIKNANSNLHKAKKAKNDEFYTLLTDIEKEMKFYRNHFKGKTIFCNCDDARESNFFKFFSLNFEFLGLKKLITTGFKEDGKGVVFIYEGDKNGNRKVDDDEIQVSELNGDGDFRSDEVIEFLKESDIVVTNPPFSLFRDYVEQLVQYDKKFIIVGNSNAITYKETFSLIKEGKVWLGRTWAKQFLTPNGEIQKFGNICWFTNLDNDKVSELPVAFKEYDTELYPHYDNYDAINVNKIKDFPYDYEGVIGVPITIIDKVQSDGLVWFDCPLVNKTMKYNIIGIANSARWIGDMECFTIINGKKIYNRILIQKVSEVSN